MSGLWKSIVRVMATEMPEYHADFLTECDPTLLERLGIFVSIPSQELAECPECHELCEIRVLQDHCGADVMYCVCPECGPSRFTPSTLKRWRIESEPLVERVAQALEIKVQMEVLVPRFLWNVGRKARREILFLRRCQEEHFKMLLPILIKHPKSILMTLTTGTAERLRVMLSNRIFALEDVTRFDAEHGIEIDLDTIKIHLGPEEGEPVKTTPRRAVRLAKIEKLVAELKEHFRRSRDHYYSVGDLLPRPTQADLARLTGLRQDDVSRCLQDKDALILQHLWKHSDALEAILNC
jgi:hypothetical protein